MADELIIIIKVKASEINHPNATTQHVLIKELAKAMSPLIGDTLTGSIEPPSFKIETHRITNN